MYIQWYGQTCFKIQTKNDTQEITILIDPLNENLGYQKLKNGVDIITYSNFNNEFLSKEVFDGTQITQKPFLISEPGEYETKGVFITGIDCDNTTDNSQKSENIIYRFDIEGVKLAHFGFLNSKKLSETQLDLLGAIDVLFIPVGGNNALSAQDAVELISNIEPRIVIPMNYAVDNIKLNLDQLKNFTNEIGAGAVEPEKRIKIIQKDLPQDDTQVKVLLYE